MQFICELEDDQLGAIDVEVTVENLVIKDDFDLDEGRIHWFVDVEFDTFEVKFNNEIFELSTKQEMYLERFINDHAINYR